MEDKIRRKLEKNDLDSKELISPQQKNKQTHQNYNLYPNKNSSK